jgi:hypothetical protein
LLACGEAVVSGDASEDFWERHAPRGSGRNVLVVMLTVAVVDKALETQEPAFLLVS